MIIKYTINKYYALYALFNPGMNIRNNIIGQVVIIFSWKCWFFFLNDEKISMWLNLWYTLL